MSISAIKIALNFEAKDFIAPPLAIGAMWRGVFGAALRANRPDLYRLFFEARPSRGGDARFDDAPAPFVLDAPFPPSVIVPPGETLDLIITLFGPGAENIPAVVDCFANAAATGLGKGRGRAALVDAAIIWRDEDAGDAPQPVLVPPMPQAVRIAFTSPLRLRVGGRIATPKSFKPTSWLVAIMRRHAALQALYGTGETPISCIPDALHLSEAQLWLQGLHRWSAQQRKEIDMSGIMGSFILPLNGLEAVWSALWQSQWFQTGSMTTAGLGACRIFPR